MVYVRSAAVLDGVGAGVPVTRQLLAPVLMVRPSVVAVVWPLTTKEQLPGFRLCSPDEITMALRASRAVPATSVLTSCGGTRTDSPSSMVSWTLACERPALLAAAIVNVTSFIWVLTGLPVIWHEMPSLLSSTASPSGSAVTGVQPPVCGAPPVLTNTSASAYTPGVRTRLPASTSIGACIDCPGAGAALPLSAPPPPQDETSMPSSSTASATPSRCGMTWRGEQPCFNRR